MDLHFSVSTLKDSWTALVHYHNSYKNFAVISWQTKKDREPSFFNVAIYQTGNNGTRVTVQENCKNVNLTLLPTLHRIYMFEHDTAIYENCWNSNINCYDANKKQF